MDGLPCFQGPSQLSEQASRASPKMLEQTVPARHTPRDNRSLLLAVKAPVGRVSCAFTASNVLQNDGLQRGEPIGECGRPGLQDYRRLNLVQRAALHCGNAIKTCPLSDLLRAEFLAAPRTNDNVRGATDYLLRRYGSVFWLTCRRSGLQKRRRRRRLRPVPTPSRCRKSSDHPTLRSTPLGGAAIERRVHLRRLLKAPTRAPAAPRDHWNRLANRAS
jgi:hypothetical protein